MIRKALIALALVTAATAFMPAEASARGGFGGGGFHGGIAGGGWRGGGWGGWRGAGWGWRGRGWGWVPPLASASVWALRALPPGAARGVGAAGALTGAIQAFRADARRGVKSGPVGAGGLSR